MAQLNSRGTLTRTRWDYFESTNGFAFVYGAVATGIIGAYLANNSTGAVTLDIYSLIWSASAASKWQIAVLLPPISLAPLAPAEVSVHTLQPDRAAVAGVVGMFQGTPTNYWGVARRSDSIQGATEAPVGGMAWLTLPPGWAVSVWGNDQPTACELSMTVWYQETVDNVAPAL